GIGAAADRYRRGHFGIAQASEAAGDRGEYEGERHRGSGIGRGSVAGEHEDTGADDAADTDPDQVEGRQRALHRPRAVAAIGLRCFRQEIDDGFSCPDVSQTNPAFPKATRSNGWIVSMSPCKINNAP